MEDIHALREAERVANDYHPSRPLRRRPATDGRLERGSAALRDAALGRGGEDGFGLLACARLLDAVADASSREEPIDPRLLDTALGIAVYVVEIGAVVARARRT